jgi:hypothetical protein
MVLDNIVGTVRAIPQLFTRNDDDYADRLSHRYTVLLLVVFAGIVTTGQLVGDPIKCWCPKHFESGWEKYTASYCWIRNTYYLDWEERIPPPSEDKKTPIIYYQWVPLILLTQALLFYAPCFLWRRLNSKTGIDLHDLMETAEKYQKAEDDEVKRKRLGILTRQMHRYLGISKKYKKSMKAEITVNIKWILAKLCCWWCGRRFHNYLVILYVIMKVIYLANSIGQFWMLNDFLNTDYHYYGIAVIKAMIAGEDWTTSPRFPRVTLCNFNIRRLGNIHPYTVQCVLPINLFNEKIYLFLWFWLVMVMFFNAYSLIIWTSRMFSWNDKYVYMRKRLAMVTDVDFNTMSGDRMLQDFVEKYLKQDGVFVFRLVEHNTDSVTGNEFAAGMWEYYRSLPQNKKMEENTEKEPLPMDEIA